MKTLRSPAGEIVRVDELDYLTLIHEKGYTLVPDKEFKKGKPLTSTAPEGAKAFLRSMRGL